MCSRRAHLQVVRVFRVFRVVSVVRVAPSMGGSMDECIGKRTAWCRVEGLVAKRLAQLTAGCLDPGGDPLDAAVGLVLKAELLQELLLGGRAARQLLRLLLGLRDLQQAGGVQAVDLGDGFQPLWFGHAGLVRGLRAGRHGHGVGQRRMERGTHTSPGWALRLSTAWEQSMEHGMVHRA